MKNLTPARLGKISACRSDLLANDIDVTALDATQVAGLVGAHLEYFQMMLGDDSTPGQILSLIRHELADNAADGAAGTGQRRSVSAAHAALPALR